MHLTWNRLSKNGYELLSNVACPSLFRDNNAIIDIKCMCSKRLTMFSAYWLLLDGDSNLRRTILY